MDAEPRLLSYSPDHPAFAGHFPGNPIVPGVLLLDAAIHALGETAGPGDVGLRVESAKFVGVVRPGDALRVELRPAAGAGPWRFVLRHGERMVAHGSLARGCAEADASR